MLQLILVTCFMLLVDQASRRILAASMATVRLMADSAKRFVTCFAQRLRTMVRLAQCKNPYTLVKREE